MVKKHLIKRTSKLTDKNQFNHQLKDGWYSETKIGGKPTGHSAKKGDIVYIAESGFAIFGHGIISDIITTEIISYNSLMNYIFTKAKVGEDKYWFSIIEKFYNRKGKNLFIMEYYIENTQKFQSPKLLQKEFLTQFSWKYLEDSFEIKNVPPLNELSHNIPNVIRAEVYYKFNLNSKSHIIDIDHLVPKSLGGPGNIEENLVPIGLSLNRYKSNKVPSGLFLQTNKFKLKIEIPKKIGPEIYLSERKYKDSARVLIELINKKELDVAKSIYGEIREFHFSSII
jgi:hypothetical protein